MGNSEFVTVMGNSAIAWANSLDDQIEMLKIGGIK